MKNIGNDRILEKFRDAIEATLGNHLRKLILFGSFARGDARPDSDYDCLVLVDRVSPQLNNAIDEVAGDILFQTGRLISAFAVAEDDYRTRTLNPLFMNVAREGIAL